MKVKRRILLASMTAATLIALTGCSNRVLDYRNAEITDGLIYATGANEPFTGTVTHLPDSFLLGDDDGYVKFMREAGGGRYAGAPFMLPVMTNDSPAFLCDVAVQNGYVDGKAACHLPRVDAKLIEAHFSKGRLSGAFVYFAPDKPGRKLAQGSFNGGQPDGTQKIYSLATGQLIEIVNWSSGTYNGDFSRYNAANGKVVLEGAIDDGKRDGVWKQYTSDGKQLIAKMRYQEGKYTGVAEGFDAETGKRTALVDKWVDGQINGERKTWDKNGILLTDEVYVDGKQVGQKDAKDAPYPESESLKGRVTQALGGLASVNTLSTDASASPAPSARLDACVQGWTAANHEAAVKAGVDDAVSSDQIQEWEAWCKQGKQAPAG
jgi:antitoxin component YwqK of YwqJK toxin-antitoxin module